jgi:hypothetical protein
MGHGGLILGSGHFSLLSQLPQKVALPSKEVKSDSKIIVSISYSKLVTPFEWCCNVIEHIL